MADAAPLERLAGLTAGRLSVPLIVAPMFEISGPALAAAACHAGAIGALPAHNAASTDQLAGWLRGLQRGFDEAERATGRRPAPLAPNLLVHRTNHRLADDLACIAENRVELVIASVGSPAPVVDALHASGVMVLADIASMRHLERALDAGVDGVVLLTAGAGGQTGWANAFAFVRAVRDRYDGPMVLAGGISDGVALRAAIVAGCDLGYMGTAFIATRESLADDGYRSMLVTSSLDDVTTTAALTGIPANVLQQTMPDADPAPQDVRFDKRRLDADHGAARAAGHTVSGVRQITTCAELIARTRGEYAGALLERPTVVAV
jgi:nitronate monooxygenase